MLSVSMTQGEVAPHHDSRENAPKNADPKKKQDNVYIKTCSDVRTDFNELFANAVDDYNTGVRSDRQIQDYYEKVQNCKRGKKSPHAVYEYVLQYGDMFNNNVNAHQFRQTTEDSKQMLVELAERLEQKYPQFKTMWAVVHADEQTPHLHWAFTPVGTGYKKGMSEQCSLTKALNNMGYYNSGDKLALTQWQDDVKAVMVEIMEEHGYTREYKNNTEKHLSTDKFKQKKEVEQATEQLEQTQQQIEVLAEVAQKDIKPERKGIKGLFQKTSYYTMDEQEHEEFMQAVEDMKRLSHNTVMSDKDREAIAAEKAEIEHLRREQEQIIKQQAEQLAQRMVRNAMLSMRQKEQEAEQAKQKAEQAESRYKALSQKEEAYIIQEAIARAEKMSLTFKKLDDKAKREMMIKKFGYGADRTSSVAPKGQKEDSWQFGD